MFRIEIFDALDATDIPPSGQAVTLHPIEVRDGGEVFEGFLLTRGDNQVWTEEQLHEFCLFRARWLGFGDLADRPRECHGRLYRWNGGDKQLRQSYSAVAECVLLVERNQPTR